MRKVKGGPKLGRDEVARRMRASEKQARAAELKIQGWTHREIAAELGYAGPSGVTKALKDGIAKRPVQAAEEARKEISERAHYRLRLLFELFRDLKENGVDAENVKELRELLSETRKDDELLAKVLGAFAPTQHRIGGAAGAPPVAIVTAGDLQSMDADEFASLYRATAEAAKASVAAATAPASGPGEGASPQGSDEDGGGEGGSA